MASRIWPIVFGRYVSLSRSRFHIASNLHTYESYLLTTLRCEYFRLLKNNVYHWLGLISEIPVMPKMCTVQCLFEHELGSIRALFKNCPLYRRTVRCVHGNHFKYWLRNQCCWFVCLRYGFRHHCDRRGRAANFVSNLYFGVKEVEKYFDICWMHNFQILNYECVCQHTRWCISKCQTIQNDCQWVNVGRIVCTLCVREEKEVIYHWIVHIECVVN